MFRVWNARKTAMCLASLTIFASQGAVSQEVLDMNTVAPDVDYSSMTKTPATTTLSLPSEPITPDPMISLLPPNAQADPAKWKKMKRDKIASRIAYNSNGVSPQDPFIAVTEDEAEPGSNDSIATAQRIRRIMSGKPNTETAVVTGSLGDLLIRDVVQAEDDGAIPLALASGITGPPDGIKFQGVIGDGPLPGMASDFDFIEVSLPGNTTFDISVRTEQPFGDLDPYVSIYLADGTLIFEVDDGGAGFDSFAQLTTGDVGFTFYIAIGGFGAFIPADPFDSTAGSITGSIGSEGAYEFELRVFPEETDTDVYSMKLREGDVFGVAARAAGQPSIRIFNSAGELEKGALGFGSFGVLESPLPVDGSGVIDYVVEQTGTYFVELSGGFGAYELEFGLFDPYFKANPQSVQLIWLDYNGGPVSKEPWFGFPLVTEHTPFRDFLPAWGLPTTDEDVRRITSSITNEVRDNLETEIRESGENSRSGVVVLGNDGTGAPTAIDDLIEQGSFTLAGVNYEVSVLEVSGTVNEAFINTIGIASTIDPGNYAVNDVALVLLDTLSAPASGFNANATFSINDVVLAPGVTKEDAVTTIVGNVAAHEAGHYIGNFHTDGVFTSSQGIMDEGPGGLFNLAGIGASGVFGAEDQVDVAFIDDDYSVLEGFLGEENTTENTAHGLSYYPGKTGGKSNQK